MRKNYAARVCEDGRIQTVREHLYGVRDKALPDARRLGCESIVELCALLHDMGKNTPESDLYQRTVGQGGEWNRPRVVHSHAGARYIYERFHDSGKDAAELAELIAGVIMCHHGLDDFLDITPTEGQYNNLLRRTVDDKYNYAEAKAVTLDEVISEEEIDTLFNNSLGELSTLSAKLSGTKGEKAFEWGMLFRMLLSVLVNADHSDAAEFSSGERSPADNADSELWESCAEFVEAKLAEFKSDTAINKIRTQISEAALEGSKTERRLLTLNVPTGGGKTLSSLRFAVNYAKNFSRSRIIYVAPFNSILEQNSAEFRCFLPESCELLEHFADLVNSENAPAAYKYYAENWSAPVIATSMVQFLNTLFDGRISSLRRMRGLADAVLIIDEVQSVPVSCVSIFNMAVNFLTDFCGATVVLCSATQPTFDRVSRRKMHAPDAELVESGCFDALGKRTKIIGKLSGAGYTSSDAADFVLKLAETKRSVLLVVNTKKVARDVYNLIKKELLLRGEAGEFDLVHLSTNMCPAHRKNAVSGLKSSLSKGRRAICVSTQLIEAGVDISFEAVVRSLAGLDSVIQAAGRCNRNGEAPLGEVYVINCRDENLAMLKTIRRAQSVFRPILLLAERRGIDVTDPGEVIRYYTNYFRDLKDELDFKVKANALETTIFDLLSDNKDVKNRLITDLCGIIKSKY